VNSFNWRTGWYCTTSREKIRKKFGNFDLTRREKVQFEVQDYPLFCV
jgi:hypothetical protein